MGAVEKVGLENGSDITLCDVKLNGNGIPKRKDGSPESDTVLLSLSSNEEMAVRRKVERISLKNILLVALVAVGIIAILGVWAYTGPLSSKAHENNTEKPQVQTLDPPDVLVKLPPSSTKRGNYSKAAVVSNGGPCAQIGVDILKKNGNAVDAAIATLFCDGVCCMQSMGIGGGFLMTIYKKSEGKAYTLNARETAPAKAHEKMYFGDSLASSIGARAAGIPGELKGYYAAYEKFGSKNVTWAELVEPTAKLCEEGVPINQHLAFNLKHHEQDIRLSETLGNILLREDGSLPVLNETIKLPQLAKTLRVIASGGADELYNGSLTKAFVNDIKSAGGIITEEDMANYKVRWEDPVVAKISGNLTLYTFPPPGSGVLLAFMLQVLDNFIVNKNIDDLTTVQRITETFKHAYGRRTEFGDPHFVNISTLVDELSSAEYIKLIRSKIHDHETSTNVSYYGAKYEMPEDHGTANVVVMDPNGDAVSVTSTVNLVFGGKFVSKSTGILLNNEMDDFSAPNITNYFGVPPSPANFIRPGKRPMSSMCPTIVVDENGDTRLVVGAAGGTKITTSVAFVTMLNLWFGKDIKQAIDEPRIHHQLMPMQFLYEYGVLKRIVSDMNEIGHKVVRLETGWRSCVTSIASYGNKSIEGNSDYRRPGSVSGF